MEGQAAAVEVQVVEGPPEDQVVEGPLKGKAVYAVQEGDGGGAIKVPTNDFAATS